MSAALSEGIGVQQCWAFSPALDLLDAAAVRDCDGQNAPLVDLSTDDIHVLIAGAGDISHAINTICLARRHTTAGAHLQVSPRPPAPSPTRSMLAESGDSADQ